MPASIPTIATHEAPDMPAADDLSLAFLQITATDLIAAMFLAQRGGTPVEIHAECGALRLIAGGIDISIPCLDGGDTSSVCLDAETFAAVYEQLRPIVKRMNTLTVFVAADGTLIINSQDTDFSTTAHGTPIAVHQPPTGLLSLAHPRNANSRTVENLFAQPA
jgi:hypothetical protein